MDSSTARMRNAARPSAFLLLLALLQLPLVPVTNGGNIDLAPLFRADSLGLVFGTAWTLTLAAISSRLTRQTGGRRVGPFLGITGLAMLVCAYAQNMVVLVFGWVLVGVCVSAIQQERRAPTKSGEAIFVLLTPAGALVALALFTGFPVFAPPAGGLAEPWQPVSVLAAGLAVVLTAGRGLADRREHEGYEARQRTDASLMALYALAAPYILAKMLVAATWHPVGSWLLVLIGMMAVLGGVYLAYASEGSGRVQAFTSTLVGVPIVGFGIATNSPLAAAGATWVMLSGLPWVVARGWRWAEVATLVAILPGLWMISQAALDTGYGMVAALLLSAYILLALLITSHTPQPGSWWVVAPVGFSLIAATLPQIMLEAMLRPAVKTMAGGVGALTTLGLDWGVGILVRDSQGTVPAALPATGLALAVLLAAVVLYWLKQLAGHAIGLTGGDTQAE